MNHRPQDLFRRYFAELDQRGIAYVILHSYETFPEAIGTDVDYAVGDADLAAAIDLTWDIAAGCGWEVVQCLQHESCGSYLVLLNPCDPTQFLKLDVCSHYLRNGCRLLDDEVLLEERRQFREFSVPRPAVECVYTLAKILAKRKPVSPYLSRLRELTTAEPVRVQQLFTIVFGDEAGQLSDWLERPAADWNSLGTMMHTHNRAPRGDRMAEWGRRWQRIRHPAGARLALLGPDGVGKSTVITGLESLLAPCFRAQRLIHFCPMLLRGRSTTPVTQPHAKPPRSVPVSWLKVVYHFIDHWLGYGLDQRPALTRGQCIIFDRNFDDLLIDPRRYRIQRAAPLVRLLRRLLPAPDLTVILDAAPETVHARKSELPVAELARQRAALRALAAANPQYVLVNAEAPADLVAQEIATRLLHQTGIRLHHRRHGGPG